LPAVRIATSEPVVIVDSTVKNLSGGNLVATTPGLPVDVTMTRVTGYGGTGLFFSSRGFKSVTIQNCTIFRTGGINLVRPTAGGTVVVTRNRQRDVQRDPRGELRHFLQLHDVTGVPAVDVSWNEIVNVFGQSSIEDVISIYRSAHVSVHDNYIKGAYPATSKGAYSGSGIMIEEGSYENEVFGNQVVDTTNVGIGIAGGRDNRVYGNKVISDGKLDNGTPLAAANVGIFVWNSKSNAGWANNRATGNTIGWLSAAGVRNNMWFPDAPGSDYALNTGIADDRLITRSQEQAEWTAWLAKLAANGIRVGA
jgi:parallel beta-helix repeat protein